MKLKWSKSGVVDEALAVEWEEDLLAEVIEAVALEEDQDQLQELQHDLHKELQYNDLDQIKDLKHIQIHKAVVDWVKVQVLNLELVLNLKVDWEITANLKVKMGNRVD